MSMTVLSGHVLSAPFKPQWKPGQLSDPVVTEFRIEQLSKPMPAWCLVASLLGMTASWNHSWGSVCTQVTLACERSWEPSSPLPGEGTQ